jgi:hypothetical protein
MLTVPSPQRRFSRHSVDLPCEIVGPDDDEPVLRWASDLSACGLWLEVAEPAPLGQALVVSFKPAVGWRAPEVTVFARVARVSRGLRSADDAPGMGIDFLDLAPHEWWQLRRWLRHRPERAPARRVPARRATEPPRFSDHPFACRFD